MTFEFTADEYQDMIDSYMGLCVACGAERDSCEPDARNYPCGACGQRKVFGVEELLLMGRIEIIDD